MGAAFMRADIDGNGRISAGELLQMVDAHPELWSMLNVNTGLDESFCKAIAQEVAMKKCDANGDGGLSKREFLALYNSFLGSPRGQLAFFHNTLFAAFDANGDGSINSAELDHLLDIFYEKSSIFAGDQRLPPKEILKERVQQELDTNKDGLLSFEEIRPLLTGSFALSSFEAA